MGMYDVKPVLHRHVQAHRKTGAGEIQIFPHVANQGDYLQPETLQPCGIVFACLRKEVHLGEGVDLNPVDDLAPGRFILSPQTYDSDGIARIPQDVGLILDAWVRWKVIFHEHQDSTGRALHHATFPCDNSILPGDAFVISFSLVLS